MKDSRRSIFHDAPDNTQDKGRWFVLFLLFLTTFGSLFAYDTIGVLQESLESALDINQFDLDMLYNIAIVPNIILPIFAGLVIDKWGIRPTFIVYSVLVAIGQAIVCLGISHSSFHMVLFGRFIFGLGYQSQYVAKSVMVSRWASPKELAFALSLSAFLSRLGTSFNVIASPSIYKDFGLPAPFITGLVLILLQIVLVVVIAFIDKNSSSIVADTRGSNRPIVFQDTCSFSKSFYLLSIGCAVSSGVFSSFFQSSTGLLTTQFGMNTTQAEEVLDIVFLISAIGLPIFGFIADRVSNRLYILPISAVLFIGAAADLAFVPSSPEGEPNFSVIENLVFYGLFYASFNAVLWSSLPSVTALDKVGIASGFTISLVEIALFILPTLGEIVHDSTINVDHGHFYETLFLAGVGVVVLGLVIWLIYEDKRLGNILTFQRFEGKSQTLELTANEKFINFENESTLVEEL